MKRQTEESKTRSEEHEGRDVEFVGDVDHGGAEHVEDEGGEWRCGGEVGDGFFDVGLLQL